MPSRSERVHHRPTSFASQPQTRAARRRVRAHGDGERTVECRGSVLAERRVQLFDHRPAQVKRWRWTISVRKLSAAGPRSRISWRFRYKPAALAGDLRESPRHGPRDGSCPCPWPRANGGAWLSRNRKTGPGDDAHTVGVQPQHPRDADRLGRHRVAVALEAHKPSGPDEHREAQGVFSGRDRQRSHPLALGWRSASAGRHARRPARPHRCPPR